MVTCFSRVLDFHGPRANLIVRLLVGLVFLLRAFRSISGRAFCAHRHPSALPDGGLRGSRGDPGWPCSSWWLGRLASSRWPLNPCFHRFHQDSVPTGHGNVEQGRLLVDSVRSVHQLPVEGARRHVLAGSGRSCPLRASKIETPCVTCRCGERVGVRDIASPEHR